MGKLFKREYWYKLSWLLIFPQVESVRRRKEELMAQRQQLEAERRRWSNKLERIEQFVLAGLGKNMVEYTLQV